MDRGLLLSCYHLSPSTHSTAVFLSDLDFLNLKTGFEFSFSFEALSLLPIPVRFHQENLPHHHGDTCLSSVHQRTPSDSIH